MNVSSFVFEQLLKQLKIPASAIRQFQIAGQLSDVDGSGFPAELFQLSAPMITRGILNFALLQMKNDWIYPFWVHRQLDPASTSFIPRAQNPLLINCTHRNWTMLGSINGEHEAIIDPHGLLTPLPREWSIDTWVKIGDQLLFPSLAPQPEQLADTDAPCITTTFQNNGAPLILQSFTGTIRHGVDVLFSKAAVHNYRSTSLDGWIFVAIRPFCPEGVAPIHTMEFREQRQLFVDGSLGIVFSDEPDWLHCSNASSGDCAQIVMQSDFEDRRHSIPLQQKSRCTTYLANAVAGFRFSLAPGQSFSVHHSVALGSETQLKQSASKSTWRVSYEKRLAVHRQQWQHERSSGMHVVLPDERLQQLFDANILALLQLHDKEFISPGPFLYHHFWFRDAVPMLHALDRLGYHKRVRQSIEGFWNHMTADGFLKGPDGEWDSNGAVLWFLQKHFMLVPSALWLRNMYDDIKQAAEWILSKRNQSTETSSTHAGLMPPSLSAEHFGTVDQYYWDTFWSAAGISAAASLAHETGHEDDAEYFLKKWQEFSADIRSSIERAGHRLGEKIIPTAPFRAFDESAIGILCGLYPAAINDIAPEYFSNTLARITSSFVNEKGFYHPLIHSGYNPYLTLHIAHSHLLQGNILSAWNIAETVFRACKSPFSLPEAIHPRTGGGAMGDGHHGWAAAEILLFLLDTLFYEDNECIRFFERIPLKYWHAPYNLAVKNVPTSIGTLSLQCEYASDTILWCTLERSTEHKHRVKDLLLHFPFSCKRVVPSIPEMIKDVQHASDATTVRCCPGNYTLKIELL